MENIDMKTEVVETKDMEIETKDMKVVETKDMEVVETNMEVVETKDMEVVETKDMEVVETNMEVVETNIEVVETNIEVVETNIEVVETKDMEVIIDSIENIEIINNKVNIETILLETTMFLNKISDEKINKNTLDPDVFKYYSKSGNKFNSQFFKKIDDLLLIDKFYNWLDTIDDFNKECMQKMVKVLLKIDKKIFRLIFHETIEQKIKQQYDTKGFLFLQDLNENDKKRFLDWAEDVVFNKIPVIQPPPPSHQRTLSRAEINLLRLQERSKQLNQPNNQQNNNWNSYKPVQSPAPGGQRVNNVYNSSSRNPNNPNGRNISVNNRRRNVPMSEL
jgi:hypothetical protein